jgi:hypothetical protein
MNFAVIPEDDSMESGVDGSRAPTGAATSALVPAEIEPDGHFTLPPRALFPEDLPTTRHRKIISICCGATSCLWGIYHVDGLNYGPVYEDGEEIYQLLPTDIQIRPWMRWRYVGPFPAELQFFLI